MEKARIGTVISVKDGIVRASGMKGLKAGEMVSFGGHTSAFFPKGMALNWSRIGHIIWKLTPSFYKKQIELVSNKILFLLAFSIVFDASVYNDTALYGDKFGEWKTRNMAIISEDIDAGLTALSGKI